MFLWFISNEFHTQHSLSEQAYTSIVRIIHIQSSLNEKFKTARILLHSLQHQIIYRDNKTQNITKAIT